MFKRMTWIKLKTGLCMLLCATAVMISPAAALTSYAADPTDVETCADIKEWIWRIENGNLYRRLYNASTGLWETDWIFVCVAPEGLEPPERP